MEYQSGVTEAGTLIDNVAGTITVPEFHTRDDGFTSGMYLAIRTDGVEPCCQDPVVGIGHLASKTGSNGDLRANNFRASWQWGDSGGSEKKVLSFPLRAGDKVKMELVALTPFEFNGTIKNLNTGQEVYRILSSPGGYCGSTTNWIGGSYTRAARPIPFTEYLGAVTWTDVRAATAVGETLNFKGAETIDPDQSWELDPSLGPIQGGLQTDCNIVGTSSFTCRRLVPTPPTIPSRTSP
ncbi:hypothetical protein RB596_005118 [Gaeumannomyces avenae]